MLRYVIKRLILLIPVLLGVSILIFALQVIAPGDPAIMMLGEEALESDLDAWRDKYGLNDPIVVQWGKYIWGIISHGDFGLSYKSGEPVSKELIARWPTTFLLTIMSTAVSMLIGIPLGILAAMNRDTWKDGLSRFLGIIGISMPNFWLALMMIILFAVKLRLLPVSGFYGPKYYVLPVLTIGILGAASKLRITRSAMLDNINQDFVRTARAKGQKESVIVRHHILGNAWIPIVTSTGMLFAVNLGGTMIMEQIFAIPGLGALLIHSINNRDWSQVRANVLLSATTICIINLLVDVIIAAIDPRVKATFASSAKRKKKVKRIEEGEAV